VQLRDEDRWNNLLQRNRLRELDYTAEVERFMIALKFEDDGELIARWKRQEFGEIETDGICDSFDVNPIEEHPGNFFKVLAKRLPRNVVDEVGQKDAEN
jgi:hypothetical protein